MDREVVKLRAHLDQTRAEIRSAVENMDSYDVVELFRDCATGHLTDMDEPALLLVGMLAALAIHDIWQNQPEEENDPDEDTVDKVASALACPRCGQDEIDSLVWIDDDHVRCSSCGTVYDPNQPPTGG